MVVVVAAGEAPAPVVEAVAVWACFLRCDDLCTPVVLSEAAVDFFAGGGVDVTTVTSSSALATDAQPRTATTGASTQRREKAVMLLYLSAIPGFGSCFSTA